MFRAAKIVASLLWVATLTVVGAVAQSGYQEVQLTQTGTISGTVKWSGPLPRIPAYPIDKDPQVCDPDSHKVRDLDRLIVGPQNGVANTVVFLKDMTGVVFGLEYSWHEQRLALPDDGRRRFILD